MSNADYNSEKGKQSNIETFAIELLKKQVYQYIYSPDIAPDSNSPSPLGNRGANK